MRARRTTIFSAMMLVWAVSAQAGAMGVALDNFGVQQPKEHKLAPAFSLRQLDGGMHALADDRGKVVFLHFWATWCVACRHEMPQIEQLWQRYRDEGLVVLGVNVDRGNLSGVQSFVHEYKLDFPFVLDPDGSVRNRYEIRALPTSYLIGHDGKIIGRIIGERNWNSQEATTMFEQILLQEKSMP